MADATFEKIAQILAEITIENRPAGLEKVAAKPVDGADKKPVNLKSLIRALKERKRRKAPADTPDDAQTAVQAALDKLNATVKKPSKSIVSRIAGGATDVGKYMRDDILNNPKTYGTIGGGLAVADWMTPKTIANAGGVISANAGVPKGAPLSSILGDPDTLKRVGETLPRYKTRLDAAAKSVRDAKRYRTRTSRPPSRSGGGKFMNLTEKAVNSSRQNAQAVEEVRDILNTANATMEKPKGLLGKAINPGHQAVPMNNLRRSADNIVRPKPFRKALEYAKHKLKLMNPFSPTRTAVAGINDASQSLASGAFKSTADDVGRGASNVFGKGAPWRKALKGGFVRRTVQGGIKAGIGVGGIALGHYGLDKMFGDGKVNFPKQPDPSTMVELGKTINPKK